MSITIATENGERLPENLLFEILSWLPVRDVLKFKTVCKLWSCFISTPRFLPENNRYYDDNCFLGHCYGTMGGLQWHQLFIDQTAQVFADEVLHKIPICRGFIYGPCDGLYYINDGTYRALWNPSINEVRTLPSVITKPDAPPNTIYSPFDYCGFGLDPLSGDYKVVIIKDYHSAINETLSYFHLALVYSLGIDSWKYCGDLGRYYCLQDNTCYIFVDGCCFWLGSFPPNYGEYRKIIIVFNMAYDSFQEIPAPDYQVKPTNYDYHQHVRDNIGMYDSFLAFFSLDLDVERLGIWTLKHSTWTKIFNIGPISNVVYPLGHWKTNKVILWGKGRKLVIYPNTLETKDLEFEINQPCIGIFAYMESLVSVKG